MTSENEAMGEVETSEGAESLRPPRRHSRDHSEPPPMLHDRSIDREGMRKCKSFWEEKIHNHQIDRLINPFSEFWGDGQNQYRNVLENAKAVWKGADKRTKLTKADDKYGMVVSGTLTEKRGKRAKDFIAGNIVELCETIKSCGFVNEEGEHVITFGQIFRAYERINDKVVGLLVRARRHGLVDFPGEMLYQRQDDHVIIKLLKIPTVEELELKYISFKKPGENEQNETPADDNQNNDEYITFKAPEEPEKEEKSCA